MMVRDHMQMAMYSSSYTRLALERVSKSMRLERHTKADPGYWATPAQIRQIWEEAATYPWPV
jgi:hypothetical protein